MKPKDTYKELQQEMFNPLLSDIINLDHSLVKLEKQIDWTKLIETFGEYYCSNNGRPGISTRLMVSLHYLKYLNNLSDEAVLQRWVENPYWQHFSGYEYFQFSMPIDSSTMTNWRKRLKKEGAEAMLNETIHAGLKMKVIKSSQLKNINIDTTVQEKNIRFPTDSRLYCRCAEKLVKASKERNIDLRQPYTHVNKSLLYDYARYSNASQFKRAQKCTKKLKRNLGRIIRDITRKAPERDNDLNDLLQISKAVFNQSRYDKNKVYSVHEPDVKCIAKGKADKKYEFGNKVGFSVTSKGGWILSAVSFIENIHDSKTLKETIEKIPAEIKPSLSRVFLDRGYRGHKYDSELTIIIDKARRGKTLKSVWKWMKQRAKIEPTIGHLKSDYRLNKNKLKGTEGDAINAILSAAAMNLKKLLGFFLFFLFKLLSTNKSKSSFPGSEGTKLIFNRI